MRLLIAGAGGHGRVVADAALAGGGFSHVEFLDDAKSAMTREGWPVVGELADLSGQTAADTAFVAAFGDAKLRLEVLLRAIERGFHCPPVIHPAAVVSAHSEIGLGSVIFAGAIVNVGARLGSGCIINTGATVDHDCRLLDGVHVGPGAHLAGGVRLGERSWFGIGAVARQGITVGNDVTVGAGAVVVADVPDGVTVVGNPARAKP
jgi:sugar O-acyltransferase (sialic acid O-acetyltransferase NeuD family)